MMDTLQARLVALVREAPAEAVQRFQQALAAGAADVEPSQELPAYLLLPVMQAWRRIGHDKVPPQALALAVGAALTMKERVEKDTPQLELVWTGPHSPSNIHTRTTAAVLREMIDRARFRILVVSYELTRENDFSQSVVESLARARAAGRKVTVALHDDSDNFWTFTQLWPKEIPLPRLLRWVGIPGNPKAKLHAKLVVVDSEDLLVTSANLTYHGLDQNIEIGVRIRGRFAMEVDRHFSYLEAEGILVPYQGASR